MHTLTKRWECYCCHCGSMRLHFHNHFHFTQIKYSDSSITVPSSTMWRVNNSLIIRLRLWVDSCDSLSLVCDRFSGSGSWYWTEGYTVAILEKNLVVDKPTHLRLFFLLSSRYMLLFCMFSSLTSWTFKFASPFSKGAKCFPTLTDTRLEIWDKINWGI